MKQTPQNLKRACRFVAISRSVGALWIQDNYRLRVGSFRVIYCVDAKAKELTVLRVADRKTVYRKKHTELTTEATDGSNEGFMRKRLLVVIGRVMIVLISSVVTIAVLFWVTEHFFFDRLLYQKSILHGYYVPWQHKLFHYTYGERDEDQRTLRLREKRLGLVQSSPLVLGVQKDPGVYTIALIGDSFAWGAGVRYQDAISQQLERKLNKHRKTNVLNYSYSGDQAVDYLATYEVVRKEKDIDLYIFEFVSNDMLISVGHTKKDFVDALVNPCKTQFFDMAPIYDIYWDPNKDPQEQKEASTRHMWESLQNPVNYCVFDATVARLPKGRAIYFLSNNFDWDNKWRRYIDVFTKYEQRALLSSSGKNIEKYAFLWKGKEPYKNFQISNTEVHPSATVHEMYAELLYREIISDPSLGFIERK